MIDIRLVFATLFLGLCCGLTGCEPAADREKESPAPQQAEAQAELQDDRVPPAAPIREDFEGKPQLSLFPRAGDYRPERDDERFPFWRTFIDHLNRISGLAADNENKNRAWSFRGIKSIDSVAFFAPLAVEPASRYQISYRTLADLPEGATSGLGIIEFDTFLWIGEQYSEAQTREHLLNSMIGIEVSGSSDEWQEKSLTLQTGPKTRMIHLVFFREGEHSRAPILIDDIEVTKLQDKK